MRGVLLAVFALLGACAVHMLGSVPDRVTPGPAPAEHREALAAARRAADTGSMRAALDLLGPLRQVGGGAAAGLDIEVERLRQDILRQRGRLGFLRAEADARIAAAPGSAMAHYLRGRLEPTGTERQLHEFRRASELDPGSLWPWLGYAYALRVADPAGSLATYQQLYDASNRHAVVAVAYASALRSVGQLREADAVYAAMVDDPEQAGVGHLGRAQVLLARGGVDERRQGWQELLQAMRARPFDAGVHAVLGELLRVGVADEQVEQCIDVLRSDPELWRQFARGRGGPLLANLLQRLLQPHAALAALQRDDDDADAMAEDLRLQHWLLLAVGDVRGFLDRLRSELPAALLEDEANQVRGRWRSVLDGPWGRGDPLGDPAMAAEFCAALAGAGLLREAEMVAVQALLRVVDGPDAQRLRALRDEVRVEMAFENELRGLLYRGYADGDGAPLDAVLAAAAQASLRLFGRDVTEPHTRFQVPLVGEMLDPFAAGLCQHLARYNRHLALGRRAGGVAEGLMLTRLSVRDLPDHIGLPLPGRCREVVGIDRSVRSLSGVLGGDLAGVALLNHYIVDYDAVRDWARSIARRRRIVAEDGRVVLDDPVPDDTAPTDPLDVSWRLAAVSPMQDIDVEAAVFEVIQLHERRHLVDSFHYLPFEANVWRGLGLLLRFGLSPDAIEAEMERRAELAALALCSQPEIVLSHIAEIAAEGDLSSPHVRGFGQLAQELAAALQRAGVEAAASLPARWDRLDRAAVRRAAVQLYAELP